jgi:ABC-type polysaccharide/polyol phosphate export permease
MFEVILKPPPSHFRRHLTLLREVTIAQTKIRDQSTALGFLWSFLHPLGILLLLYLFFEQGIGIHIEHYPIFLLIGLIHYTHFSKSTVSSMHVLYDMRAVTTNVIFPKEILVFGSILSDVPEFAISMVIVVAIAIIAGVPASTALVGIPLVVVLQLIVVLWISLLLAGIYVFVRDVDHIYEVGLRALLFITPIFYSVEFLGPLSRRLVVLNPLTGLISFSRTIVLQQHIPLAHTVLGFLLVNLILACSALMLFRRMEPALIEHL